MEKTFLFVSQKNEPFLADSFYWRILVFVFRYCDIGNRLGVNRLGRLGGRLGVKATLYTLLIRRNVIGFGYGAAVADRIGRSFLPYYLQGKPKRKEIPGYKRPPEIKGNP